MNIAGTFIFHNVGQGLFYSGTIQADNNNLFHFVYDCGCTGSKPSRDNAIKLYRRIMGINESRKIHLLILSHLHEDHINGLKELLKGGVQIDTMVIPYFSETSKQLARIDSNSRNRYLQAFYDDSYRLPARRIIIIGAPEDERSEDIDNNFMIDVNEPSPESRIFTGNSVVIKYRNFWEFRLENMPFPQTEIDSYVHELEQNHGKTLDQLLQDKKFVRDLRRKTKNIFHA